MRFPSVVGILCLSLFCCALLCVFSSLQSFWRKREREKAGCFAFIVLLMSCYCKCSVTLPHVVVSWSVVCDSGISWSYSLTFWCWRNGTYICCKHSFLMRGIQMINPDQAPRTLLFVFVFAVTQKTHKTEGLTSCPAHLRLVTIIWATTWDFQQCGILTSVDSDEPVQPSFKFRNSVSSLSLIEYSSD